MKRKRLLANVLIVIIIFSSIVPLPGYVGASTSSYSPFGEQETKPWWWDDPILSEDDWMEAEDDYEVFDAASSSNASSSNAGLASDSNAGLASASNLLATGSNMTMAVDLTVQVNGPRDIDDTKDGIQTRMRTFVDETNTPPLDFVLGLQVTNGATSLSGAYIDIPLDCIPDGVTPPYATYDVSNTPIYTFDEAGSTLTDVIERYETITDTEGTETLRLYIKEDANQGVYNLLLRFKLNEEYYGRIPPGGTSWIVKPSYNNSVNEESLETVEILTTANPTDSVVIERQSPTGNEFSGTSIVMLCTLNNRDHYEALLKPGSYSYVKVPAEFSVAGAITTAGAKVPLPALDYEGPQEETIDGILYHVYKKQHGNTQDTWTNWNHNSVVGYTFNRLYLDITVPSDYEVGKEFDVYFGAELTRENGVMKKLDTEVDYKKIEPLSWSLETNQYHGHSSGLPPSCGIEDGAVGTRALNSEWVHAGFGMYNHSSSTRNMGLGTAKNVRLELYSTSSGSARLNYNQVEVFVAAGPYPNRASGPENGTPCWFKVEFMIGNENGTPDRKSDVIKSDNKTFTVSPDEMPVLAAGEYISKVIVTPMGADGTKEGEWLPGNLISLKYQPKAWPDQMWPDGTPIPNEESPVTMMWTLYSDNETMPAQNGRERTVTYLPQRSVSARAQMISTDSTDRGPGDTVIYILNGYNNLARIGNPWIDPYLIIAVPKVLQLKDPGLPKIYEDLVENGNDPTEVYVKKMPQSSSSAEYDFYELDLSGITQAPRRDNPAFRIPLEFQVTDSALQKTYKIPFVIVSQKDRIAFSQFGFDVNNLEPNIAGATAGGLGFHVADNYTAIKSGHTDLTIIRRSGVSADISIRSNTVDWSNLRMVSVSPGEQVDMKLTLKNTGNVTLNGVKLYNILPYDGDSRGSSGDIVLTALDVPVSAKVWYSTESVENLPSYGSMELTTFNPSGPLWSETAPQDLNDVTAFYIDFEGIKIKPGEELAPIIKFEIPNDTEAYTAYNQFKYIVSDENTQAVVMQAAGNIKGFSTEGLNLGFETGADESITINNMPANVSKLREHTPENIVIPAGVENTPTRTGYTFLNWKNNETGETYSRGDPVIFAAGVNKITLEAQWDPMKINVTYDVNGGQPFDPPITPVLYRYDQVLEATDLPASPPVREGYQFKGWSTRYASDEADFGVGTKIEFTTDTTVYAVWEELYTLTVSQQTAGAFADKTLVFDYEVTFENADGSPYQKELKYEWLDGGAGSITDEGSGKYKFSLGEGQRIRFQYFVSEDNVRYRILEILPESAKGLYQPYVNATIDSDGKVSGGTKTSFVEGIIGAGETQDTADFINERTDVPITGIVVDNNSSHMMVWIAVLGLLLFSTLYLYFRRKRLSRLR